MAKNINIRIEEAHEKVLVRIGEVFGPREIISVVCPVNKYDAQKVKNYTFVVKCSCGNIEYIKAYNVAQIKNTINCKKCKPASKVAEDFTGMEIAFLNVLKKVRTEQKNEKLKIYTSYYDCQCKKCGEIYEVSNSSLKFYKNYKTSVNGKHIKKVPEFCPHCYKNGVNDKSAQKYIGLKYGVIEVVSFARSEKIEWKDTTKDLVFLNVKCHNCNSTREIQLRTLRKFSKAPTYCLQPGCKQELQRKIDSGEKIIDKMELLSQVNPFNPNSRKTIHRSKDESKKLVEKLIDKPKGCFKSTKLIKISTNYKDCEFELTCECGSKHQVKYNTVLEAASKQPQKCKKCIGNGRIVQDTSSVKLNNTKYDKLKIELVNSIVGPYTIISITPRNDIYRTMNNSDVILKCNKCGELKSHTFKEFNALRGRIRKQKELNIEYSGCNICTPNELNFSKIKFDKGYRISDTQIISEVIGSGLNTQRDTKYKIHCSCCNKYSIYSYGLIKKITEGFKACKGCLKKQKRLSSINLYKSYIGKTFGIHRIIKGYKYKLDNNKSKYVTVCSHCQTESIKTLSSLRNSLKHPGKFCEHCKDKKYDTTSRISAQDDLTGMRFGIFKVLNFSHSDVLTGNRIWLTECNCGSLSERSTGSLSILIRGKKQDYCKDCMQTIKNKFKPGDILENGVEILDMDFTNRLITYNCGTCKTTHTVKMDNFNINVSDNRNNCKNCRSLTHGESHTKFYKDWQKLITRLTNKNIPFDNRWLNYIEFAKDLKDTFQDNHELKSNCNIWNKNNCKWIPID